MDKEAAIGLARRFSELVSQHMSARFIVLHGSYAEGTASSDFDIDKWDGEKTIRTAGIILAHVRDRMQNLHSTDDD